MAKQKRPQRKSIFDDLPYVAEIKEARQLASDHWQGIDATTGELLDVRGGAMPKRLLAIRGCSVVGLIRVTPA